MSRVVYSDQTATADQEALRQTHRVRLVSGEEEGNGVDALPGGVYGFTYSPGLANAPLFAVRRYRSYETHKRADGAVLVIGFASVETAHALVSGGAELTAQIHPQPEDGFDVLVAIPYSRIRRHRQYAAPNQSGFTVTVVPAA